MSGADAFATNTMAHTADTPQLLLAFQLYELLRAVPPYFAAALTFWLHCAGSIRPDAAKGIPAPIQPGNGSPRLRECSRTVSAGKA
jgi:hypothetical protein